MLIEEAFHVYSRFSEISEKTRANAESMYKVHIAPYWHEKDLLSITSRDVESWMLFMAKEKKLAYATINVILTKFLTILRKCIQYEFLDIKCPAVKYLPCDPKRYRFLSYEEAELLLAGLASRSPLWHDIALLSLNTGMRLTEIRSMRGENFDEMNKKVILFTTKTHKQRLIPLNETALDVLQKNYKGRSLYIFESPKNSKTGMLSHRHVTFDSVVNEIGLNKDIHDRRWHVCFHTLRHTFASWLVQKGVDLKVVSSLLGHSTIHMTERYAHIAGSQEQEAVSLLPRLKN